MSVVSWISLSIASSITLLIQILTYAELIDKKKFEFNIINVFLLLIGGVIVTYNTYLNINALRAYISYSLLISLEFLILKESFSNTIIKGSICYILAIFVEIFVGVIVLLLKLNTFDTNTIFKIVLSIIIVLIPYLLLKIKVLNKSLKQFFLLINKPIIPVAYIFITVVFTLNLAFKYFNSIKFNIYLSNIIIITIFLISIIIILFKEYKVNNEVKKTKVLLNFMTDYEKQIDEDRILRHEILNNLLLLKSYDNKNSKKFNETLNELIDSYNKKNIKINNIYNLPSGLKGIIYYKINKIKNKNAKLIINISKKISNEIESLDNKQYAKICKIVSITFDNSIEAAMESNEKIISFDIYHENNNIIIELANTFNNKIELEKLNVKNYSTKGKGRGIGLYIVNNIIKNSNNILFEQSINKNIFLTKITIIK